MRNLKRVLALAMALVMILGMMVIGSSAASYSDEAAISAEYADAVEILSGMGIFKGTGAGFGPKQILDRASAAALVYRVITGDVKDKQVELYDYSSFADVAEGAWYTPYITYAANGGYIKGFNGNAMPNDTVTGIQVLAMMLRAAGYGQNGEFEGDAWKDGILTTAKELGIISGISTNDLDKGASRELVAQLIWNAINVNMVAYSPILNDYIPVTVKGVDANGKIAFNVTQTLAQKVFDLASVNDRDHWGRPAKIWFADNKAADGEYDKLKETKFATIEAIPDAVYTTEVSECDIAADLGLKANATKVTLEKLNGDNSNYADGYIEAKFVPTKKIGAQGRLTEVYETKAGLEIVMIDQYLAKVVKTTEVEYDKNGHITEYAYLYLDIYNVDTDDDTVAYDVVLADYVNWEYSRNDMLLVYLDEETDYYVEIVDYADSMVGAQTKLTTKASHVVDGTEYMDAVQFNLDQAGNQTSDHTWYFDTYGNLIGVVNIKDEYSFGTISSIYWQDSFGGENGYAVATITYMDGTTSTEKVFSITLKDETTNVLEGVELSYAVEYDRGWVGSSKQHNEVEYTNVALYQIKSGIYGLELTECTEIEGAALKTGVTTLKISTAYADKNTMFLVWNSITEEYETYTGIKNIPTYGDADDVYTIWAAELETGKDVDAEYVFVADPAIKNETTALYFNSNVSDVETDLYRNAPTVYTVNGGYLNNVAKQPIQIVAPEGETKYADNAVWKLLDETKGLLVVLTLTNGYVTGVTPVSSQVLVDAPNKFYAMYEGKLGTDVTINRTETRLTGADNYSYDISEIAAPIGAPTWDKAAGMYVWTVYTTNTYDKTAQFVYVSKTPLVAGVDAYATFAAKAGSGATYDADTNTLTVPYGTYAGLTLSSLATYVDITWGPVFVSDSYADGVYTLKLAGKDYGADSTFTLNVVEAAAPAPEAVIDGVKYATLADAVTAAAGKTVTIVLTDDVTLEGELAIPAGADVTLNLAGKTITADTAIRVLGTLTITGNGTIVSEDYCLKAGDASNAGTLTIENGTFVSTSCTAVQATKGVVTINGGSFAAEKATGYTDDYRYLLNCYDSNYDGSTTNIVVNGGTFKNFDPSNNLAEGANTSFLATGATVTSDTDAEYNTWYTVE